MGKSEFRKKVASIIVICIIALCVGICAIFGFVLNRKGAANSGAENPYDDAADGKKQFTFGQTYTIGGKQYKLGQHDDESIDYYTILGLNRDEYEVNLNKFTYMDGTDRTDETTSVRNAGTYEFEIVSLNGEIEPYADSIVVYGAQIKVDVNQIGAFVNAESKEQWAAHGDITTIYQHNDGWCFAQVEDKATVNTRTITNASYNYDGNRKTVKIKDEKLLETKLNGQETVVDPESKTSKYRYGGTGDFDTGTGGFEIDITEREGVAFSATGEYVASLKFNAPESCTFVYGDESTLTEKYRMLDIPEKTRNAESFVLKKYWYIVKAKSNTTMKDVQDYVIGMCGVKNGGEPYSPFALGSDVSRIWLDYDIEDFTTTDKKYSIVDTITFGDDVLVNEPNVEATEDVRFAIEYEPADGSKKVTIRELGPFESLTTWVGGNSKQQHPDTGKEIYTWTPTKKTAEQIKEVKNTIPYYVNKSMPAGTYTLTLIRYNPSDVTSKVTGEYKLYVLPRPFDSDKLTDLNEAMLGKYAEDGYLVYALGSNKLHENIDDEKAALDASLKYQTAATRVGYWAVIENRDTVGEDKYIDKNSYYDTKVEIGYNRDGYGSAYVSKEQMAGSFSATGSYDIYYSVSAKNYVTAGGSDAADRTERSFTLKLSTGVSIKNIYDMRKSDQSIYFKDVTYAKDQVLHTNAADNIYYTYGWEEDDFYRNAGVVYVKLVLDDAELTVWDTTGLEHEDEFETYYKDYFKLVGDDTLLVYYNILPADNRWMMAPRMSSWNYDHFDKDNTIAAEPMYGDTISYRFGIRQAAGDSFVYKWLNAEGKFDENGVYFTKDYFIIGEDGNATETDITKILNKLDVLPEGQHYYLDSKVEAVKVRKEVKAQDPDESPTYIEVTNVNEYHTSSTDYTQVDVWKTPNGWAKDSTPYVIGWAYKGFQAPDPDKQIAGNFNEGTAEYNTDGVKIEYKLYAGKEASGKVLLQFNALGQEEINAFKALHCDTYTLNAFLKGADNYLDLSQDMIFSVAKAENSWDSAPVMIGWPYGGFEERLFTLGTAKFDEDEHKSIKYVIRNGLELEFITDDGSVRLKPETVEKLKALPANGYVMEVSLEGTDDYKELKQDITFNVTRAANEWTADPSIKGWTYNALYDDQATDENKLISAAVVKFGQSTVKYTILYMDDEGNVVTDEDVKVGETAYKEIDFDTLVANLITDLTTEKRLNRLSAGGDYGGRYILRVEVPGTPNYSAIDKDLRFTVAKAENSWKDQKPPTIDGWTYGQDANSPSEAEATVDTGHGIEYKYYGAVRETGGGWTVDYDSPVADLATAKVGHYMMVATVKGNDNYIDLNFYYYFQISKQDIKWNKTIGDFSWTLAATNILDSHDIIKLAVITTDAESSIDGDPLPKYTLVYLIERKVNGSPTTTVNTISVTVNQGARDNTALLAALKGLETGDYIITVAAVVDTAGNYDTLDMKVDVSVSLASFDDDGNITSWPTDTGWTWGVDDSQKSFGKVVVTVSGAVVTYRIGSGSAWSIEYTDYDIMLKDLRQRDVGTYTVEITVKCENYKSIVRNVTVKITKAENYWTNSTEDNGFKTRDWDWGTFDSDWLKMPTAKYGNGSIVYTVLKDGATFKTFRASDYREGKDNKSPEQRAFDDLVADITSWGAGSKYEITVSITGTTNYSAPTSIECEFKINKLSMKWDEATESTNGKEVKNKQYGDDFDDIKEPKPNAGTVDDKAVVYTLRESMGTGYKYSGNSWTDLLKALKACEAGEYTINANIAGDANHNDLSYKIIVTISVKDNEWDEWTGDKNTTAKDLEWTYGSSSDPQIAFVPKYNPENLTVKVNGVNVPYSGLIDYIRGLNVGEYLIAASVAADKKYGDLIDTVLLKIGQANNSWTNNLVIASEWDYSKVAVEIDTELVFPIAANGDSAKVVVTAYGSTTSTFELTINYVIEEKKEGDGEVIQRIKKVNENDLNALIARLCGLDVVNGGYTISVTVGEQKNYKELVGQSKTFTVRKGENRWIENYEPQFVGTNVNKTADKTYEWIYDSEISIVAASRFGTYEVSYYSKNENGGWDSLSSMPTHVGTYKAVFFVNADVNFNAVADYELIFTITGKEDRTFSVSPGVSNWEWGNYAKDANKFTGIPVSNGEVTFEIRSESGATTLVPQFKLVNSKGEISDNPAENLYAPQWVIDMLNSEDLMTLGTYRLYLYIAPTGDYMGFEYWTTFNVTEAKNNWTETPKITSWYQGGYKADVNRPTARARYGNPVIVITAMDSSDVYYNSSTNVNRLATAGIGWYTMTVRVAAEPGKYDGLVEIIDFQVFFNSDQNVWVTVPGIEGWTANIDDSVNMPSGQPLRGLPYFEFYKAEFENDFYQLGEKIEAGDDAHTVLKGKKYADNFYIPTAPGTYFMLSYAINEDDSDDNLGVNHSSRIMFTIHDRNISWDQSVRIPSILYLGDRESWPDPTAKTDLTGDLSVKITYRYLDAATRRDLGSQIPAEAGKYIVVAYAYARYTPTITSEMMFEVALSKNAWIDGTAPSIENWSEEFSASSPNPVGEAMFGTITYMYINKERPDIIITDKPTAAGRYIMIARVELEGYETLEARYEFVIEPAFDTTFVLIDTILAAIACIFAIVVIIYAVRRYKEN